MEAPLENPLLFLQNPKSKNDTIYEDIWRANSKATNWNNNVKLSITFSGVQRILDGSYSSFLQFEVDSSLAVKKLFIIRILKTETGW